MTTSASPGQRTGEARPVGVDERVASSSRSPSVSLRAILTLALPIILARATQTVIGFCDALMVAPLGADALAATTTGALNSYSFVMFPIGAVFIVQSFASQLVGRGEPQAARRFAWYALGFAVLFGLLALGSVPLVRPVLGLFGYSPSVRRLMGDYLVIRLLGTFAVIGTEALGNWYSGVGRPTMQMRAGVIAMIANVALCWVLIYGKLGAPALGVAGSAWASTIASTLGFAYLLVEFLRQPGEAGAPALGIRWDEVRRFVRFGVPNGFNWFLEFASFTLFINGIIGHLGTLPLAGTNVVLQINSVAFMPALALGSAGAILVGQAIGAGARDVVPTIVRRTAGIAIFWMLSIAAVYLVAAEAILALFTPSGSDGPALAAVGALVLRLSAGWQLFDALAIVVGEALRAAGDTRWCMWARIVLAWPLFLPLSAAAIFWWGGGVPTAILSIIVYLAALAGLFVWRFRSGAWRRIELIEPLH